jgi:protein-L-isoaspartate O-methyltransferase
MTGFEERRSAMVRDQLQDRGISDPHVLKAMAKVRREAFVPPGGIAQIKNSRSASFCIP